MNPRTDRLNRAVLIILGLILTILGVYFLLRSTGAVFDRDANLLGPDLREWARDNRRWLFVAAGALAALVGLLALFWLAAQGRRWEHGSNDLTYFGEAPVNWRGVVSSGAIESAVEDGINRNDAVEDVSARLDLDADPPHAELRVSARRGTDLPALSGWIKDSVLGPTASSLERPELASHIRYRLVEAPARTVR